MRLVVLTCGIAFLLAGTAHGADSQSRVTIFARPAVVAWAQPATVFGAAAGAAPGS